MKRCSKCKKLKLLKFFAKQKSNKDGYKCICKECISIYYKKYYKSKNYKRLPWKNSLHNIKTRCNNPNFKFYKYYGGRGIKCLITEEELKELWFRDKAYLMQKPSIDRIDNDGNYIFDNCRFIELSKNSTKDNIKAVLQYDKNGHFIKKWNSQKEAGKNLKINKGNISACVCNIRKSAGGFIWRNDNV
jgi:hypothetical protein